MDTSSSVRRHGNLAVRIDQDERSLAVRPVGELDIASAPALEDSLRHALESGASSIALDLTRVTFIDSAGVRVLLWAAGHSREEGDRLHIDSGSAGVRRLLELTDKERARR
jgi:anti-sigma B factor antagonist